MREKGHNGDQKTWGGNENICIFPCVILTNKTSQKTVKLSIKIIKYRTCPLIKVFVYLQTCILYYKHLKFSFESCYAACSISRMGEVVS